MQVNSITTDPVEAGQRSLTAVLDQYLLVLPERSVVAITSKIVSLCENHVVPLADNSKVQLAMQEADYYLPAESNPYGQVLTIKNNALVMAAGVDARNTHGFYTLLPQQPQATAQHIWSYLKRRFKLSEVGVVITDSHTTPLRMGAVGFSLAYCGFVGVNAYEKVPDIFGETMTTHAHVADALSVAAVYCMGETNERTPLSVISDIPHIHFTTTTPSTAELNKTYLSQETDVYAPLLTAAPWQRGKHHSKANQ